MRSGEKIKDLTIKAALLAESGLLGLMAVNLARRKQSEGSVRELKKRVIQAAEDERRRIGQELHDDIGQRLSLISMQLSALGRLRSSEVDGFHEDLEDARRELDSVIADVHDLSHTLHSAAAKHLGLEAALRDLCRQIHRRHSLKVNLNLEEPPEDLDPEVALCVYRVAQEALNNIIRHSGSAQAELRLFLDGDKLRMQVVDFGVGFDAGAAPVGLGMGTMQERAMAIGGAISVMSKPGAGTTVSVEAPCRRASPEMPELAG